MSRFIILGFFAMAMLFVGVFAFRLVVPVENEPPGPMDPAWLPCFFIFIIPIAFIFLLMKLLSAWRAPHEEAQFLPDFLRTTLEAD